MIPEHHQHGAFSIPKLWNWTNSWEHLTWGNISDVGSSHFSDTCLIMWVWVQICMYACIHTHTYIHTRAHKTLGECFALESCVLDKGFLVWPWCFPPPVHRWLLWQALAIFLAVLSAWPKRPKSLMVWATRFLDYLCVQSPEANIPQKTKSSIHTSASPSTKQCWNPEASLSWQWVTYRGRDPEIFRAEWFVLWHSRNIYFGWRLVFRKSQNANQEQWGQLGRGSRGWEGTAEAAYSKSPSHLH